MAVTVTRNDDGGWHVHFPVSDEEFIDLPAESTRTEPEEGVVHYGTATTYLKTDDTPIRSFSYISPGMPISYVMQKTARGRDTTNAQRNTAFEQLEAAWGTAMDQPGNPEVEEEPQPVPPKGGRKTRKGKRKTRRTKKAKRTRRQ
jgi:hypothetical protein